MKKSVSILTLIALLISCMFLSSCDPTPLPFPDSAMDGVSEVQLIYYDNPDAEEYMWYYRSEYENDSDFKSFDTSKMKILEILSEEKQQSFVDFMCSQSYMVNEHEIDSPDGNSVRIVYENGDFMVISVQYLKKYCARFNSAGECIKMYGNPTLSEEEVNRFFTYQIPRTYPRY